MIVLIIQIRFPALFFCSLDFDFFFKDVYIFCIYLRTLVIKDSHNRVFVYLTKIYLFSKSL